MAANARELARLGRIEQLKILKAYEDGDEVTFKVHNKPSGFKLKKADVKPKKNQGATVQFTDEDVLHDAVVNGDMGKVNELLDGGVNVNATDTDGMTPLHRACIENYLNIASTLVKRGADISRQDNDWWTPLHAAASSGNWRICNLLFANGADPSAVNAEGDLPIDLVADTKVEGIIQREMETKGVTSEDLIEGQRQHLSKKMMDDMKEAVKGGVDLNKRREFGATWLHVAACCGYTDVVQLLLDQPSVDANVADVDGNTPLHQAVFFQQYECVMYLVAKGADMQATNNLNQKPIILSEDQTMIRLLTALDKKTQQVREKMGAGVSRSRYTGSISRSSRANKGIGSRKDRQGEANRIHAR